ncbi:SDR family NAD(P)-dependent oxidoreductase, partial [bacterium]|nr:SDR family NAD(P)-dependent oxidoreductase [bacterium]
MQHTSTMQGKTVLVTGATNGIGEAIAEDLARMGANIVVVSRSAAKCAATAERLRAIPGSGDIRYYTADLSLQAEVRALVERLNADLPRLDVLVNNAGAWFRERELTSEGIEMNWALNHLGGFLLTEGLTDLLKRTAAEHGAARIINQSSVAHLEGQMRWDDLMFERHWDDAGRGNMWAGWGVYAQSKLANVLHAFALARSFAGTGVVANAVHPGVVVTGFAGNNGLMYRLAAPVRRLFNRSTPHEGAAPAVYLASA